MKEVEITIKVSEAHYDWIKSREQGKPPLLSNLDYDIIRAYEIEQNKIQVGDWVTSRHGRLFRIFEIDCCDNAFDEMKMISTDVTECTKLPPELQEGLTKFMESQKEFDKQAKAYEKSAFKEGRNYNFNSND